ncbi:MAG: phosphoglucosamine mutase [Candidatus Nanopelagicales bacterium]|nr:phosphoglucosamine mutase [Candidatus Nanopelagicales bacterium]
MGRLFGTDGVRGLANVDLTAELALRLGQAAARVLAAEARSNGHRPRVLIGRDPRPSGEFLEAALAAGLAGAGADVDLVGIAPTPAVAFLTARQGADFGAMISASHNPMPDNGIKFFAAGGRKLPDSVEDRIESALAESWELPTGNQVGRIRLTSDAVDQYLNHLMEVVPVRLGGLRVVVDCANGAAAELAPAAYRVAGAEVIATNVDTGGDKINDGCGSTHLDALIEAVIEGRADIGIAHDGDADRCLAVDAQGAVIDGDQILAILAIGLRDQGRLVDDTLVATVMSNLGLKQAMAANGIKLVETPVGDRYVLEAMTAAGYNLGGEQSGHVIMADWATTGDGILTALSIMERMATTGRSLAELAGVMRVLPQILINVAGVDRTKLADCEPVRVAVSEAEAELGDAGRVLLRPSGTEPLIRVMVEAPTQARADAVAGRIAEAVRTHLAC